MDEAMHFWGLVAIAGAIYSGLHAIAAALSHRTVDVNFSKPINVVHHGENDGAPT